jgi:hypothetical protein
MKSEGLTMKKTMTARERIEDALAQAAKDGWCVVVNGAGLYLVSNADTEVTEESLNEESRINDHGTLRLPVLTKFKDAVNEWTNNAIHYINLRLRQALPMVQSEPLEKTFAEQVKHVASLITPVAENAAMASRQSVALRTERDRLSVTCRQAAQHLTDALKHCTREDDFIAQIGLVRAALKSEGLKSIVGEVYENARAAALTDRCTTTEPRVVNFVAINEQMRVCRMTDGTKRLEFTFPGDAEAQPYIDALYAVQDIQKGVV